MSTLLKTRLKMLVDSGIPGNNTLIDVEDAKYILRLMGEFKALQEYSDQADEDHWDECAKIQADKIKINKRLS